MEMLIAFAMTIFFVLVISKIIFQKKKSDVSLTDEIVVNNNSFLIGKTVKTVIFGVVACAVYAYFEGLFSSARLMPGVWNSGIVGGFLGSLLLAFMVSRLIKKYSFQSQSPINKAVLVNVCTLGILLGFGIFGFGLHEALIHNVPAVAVWLFFDLL